MMTKLLITNYERNVLINSYLLKNTPELDDIRRLLVHNKHISENDVSTEMARRIKKHKADWLRVTYLDLTKDKSRSSYYVKNGEKFTCYFCNKPLTSKAYFVTDKDDKVFQVGSECVKKIANPEFMINSQLAKNSREQKRLEKLQANYPEAIEVAKYNVLAIRYMFKLVLSKKELDKLQNIVKKCHNIVRRYISGKGSGTGDLSLYTKEFNRYKNWLMNYHTDNLDTPSRFPTSILTNMIITGQKDEANKIYDNVSKSDGIFTNDIAIKIKNEEFLNWCLSNMLRFDGYEKHKITVSKFGEFNMVVGKRRNNYWYKVDSSIMLRMANYPKIKPLSVERLSLLKDGMIPTPETRKKLIADFILLLNNNKFHIYHPNLKRLSDRNYRKYSNNIYVYSNKGDLAIFSIDDILNKIMLDYITTPNSVKLNIHNLVDNANKITVKELTQQIEKDIQIDQSIKELF